MTVIAGCILTGLVTGRTEPSAPDSRSGDFAYLAAYFKDIGERDGLFMAASRDGVTWEELAGEGAPLLRPKVGSWRSFRDPSLSWDESGGFRLVWTAGADGFGFSSSRDLKTWTEPRLVPAFAGTGPTPWKNVWAPEIFRDSGSGRSGVIWCATPTSVAHPNEASLPWHKRKYDNRHYFQTTSDWETFSPPEFFPGNLDVPHIDGMIFDADGRTFFLYSRQQKLFLRSAPDFSGPYSDSVELPSPPAKVEGGFAVRAGAGWRVYFDRFLESGKYGFVESADLVHWSEPREVVAPFAMRHGSIVALPVDAWLKLVEGLKAR